MIPTRVVHHWLRRGDTLDYLYVVTWPDGEETTEYTWRQGWPEPEYR